MKALVTGASGFIGSAVARALLRHGFTVRVLQRPQSESHNIDALGDVEIVEGNLEDPESLIRAVAGCEALFHVAADYRLWSRDPAAMYRVNVDGTMALMRAAIDARMRRIVYTSSVATIGLHNDDRPADESVHALLADMTGHYKRSKYVAEQRVLALAKREAAPIVVVNPSAPIGPGDVKPTPTGQTIYDIAHGRCRCGGP